jgi:hypothetical protein
MSTITNDTNNVLNKVTNCLIEIDGKELNAKYVRTKSTTILYPGWRGEPDYTKTYDTYIISFKEEGEEGYIKMETSEGGEYDKEAIVCESAEIVRPYLSSTSVYAKSTLSRSNEKWSKIHFITK